MTAPTTITIWDVEHGVSILVKTPNQKNVILDCGASPNFSPAIYLYFDLKVRRIDYLVISHPHEDHIHDLDNFLQCYEDKIRVYRRNKSIDRDAMEEDNPDLADQAKNSKLDKYFAMNNKFTASVDWENDPKNPDWGKGCTFCTFGNKEDDLSVNNKSVVTFVRFGNETILYGGDLEEKGWLKLLNNPEFVKLLERTTILIASHHGRDSGYCREIFDHFKPKLVIVSAGRYSDSDATSKYDYHVEDDFTVTDEDGNTKRRKLLSTRNDGHIKLQIYDDERDPLVTIGIKTPEWNGPN